MEKSRLQMTELERAEADRDEARQEALDLRAALRNVVAAADKLIGEVETAGEHGYLGIQDETYNKLTDETTAAKEVLN